MDKTICTYRPDPKSQEGLDYRNKYGKTPSPSFSGTKLPIGAEDNHSAAVN